MKICACENFLLSVCSHSHLCLHDVINWSVWSCISSDYHTYMTYISAQGSSLSNWAKESSSQCSVLPLCITHDEHSGHLQLYYSCWTERLLNEIFLLAQDFQAVAIHYSNSSFVIVGILALVARACVSNVSTFLRVVWPLVGQGTSLLDVTTRDGRLQVCHLEDPDQNIIIHVLCRGLPDPTLLCFTL